MTTISVPVAGQTISVTTFGTPVVNALNAITDGTNVTTTGSGTFGGSVSISGNLTVTGVGQVQLVRKTANETVNNSSALQDDDHLFLTLAANATFEFTLRLNYTSGTTPDLKFGWTFQSGTTMFWSGVDSDTAGAIRIAGNLIQTSVPAICGSGGDLNAFYTGIIATGSVAGTFRLQWAQSSATASNSTIYAGSYLKSVRTA